ncbi:HGGxSTG domain-containing protein [Sphingopyxis fribergensis]|uniref:HGGxSTG domain-containing protein n=1 Tax=Sphingopyxis fribergensis TaxID=1515612 RepID=UPI003899E8E4
MADSPRCGARTRKGTACQSPAVAGRRRCRMHGGTNPGAPIGNQNAFKHGRYSAETIAVRKMLRAMRQQLRESGL